MSRLKIAVLVAFGLTTGWSWQVDPVFAKIAGSLRTKTVVPVRLPVSLPDMGQGKSPVYAIVEQADARGYRVMLAWTSDCNGASFCRLGSLSGVPTRQSSPHLSGTPVQLIRNTKGFFAIAECGAGCTDSVISWSQDGFVYSAGLKGASVKDVVPLADAAITAAPGKTK